MWTLVEQKRSSVVQNRLQVGWDRSTMFIPMGMLMCRQSICIRLGVERVNYRISTRRLDIVPLSFLLFRELKIWCRVQKKSRSLKWGLRAPARECSPPTPSVPLHPERGKRDPRWLLYFVGGGVGGVGAGGDFIAFRKVVVDYLLHIVYRLDIVETITVISSIISYLNR